MEYFIRNTFRKSWPQPELVVMWLVLFIWGASHHFLHHSLDLFIMSSSSDSDSEDDLFMSRKRRQETAPSGLSEKAETSMQIAIQVVKRQMEELTKYAATNREFVIKQNSSNPLLINIDITPSEGYWEDKRISWSISIPNDFPYTCPTVLCLNPIWHPNIDLAGKPCVSVLHKGWTPASTLTNIVVALLFILEAPNPNDPLNHTAAEEMKTNLSLFESHIQEYIKKTSSSSSRYY